jgi:hypothetical protein
MSTEPLVFRPQQERKLNFRGREILTADLKDGNGYVSVRSLCDAFGLDQRAQRKRLIRQQGYFEPYTATILITTAGGPQPSLCLMASAVPLFMTGVEFERVQDQEAHQLIKAFWMKPIPFWPNTLVSASGVSSSSCATRWLEWWLSRSILRRTSQKKSKRSWLRSGGRMTRRWSRSAPPSQTCASRSPAWRASPGRKPGLARRTGPAPPTRGYPRHALARAGGCQTLSGYLHGYHPADRCQSFRRYPPRRIFPKWSSFLKNRFER